MPIDKIQIQKARQTDLAEYLRSVGVPLVRNGHRHAHKEHDSLIFTKNAYYWNSRQEKGNAIDYLTRNMGMSFADAVQALTGFTPDTVLETQDKTMFNGLTLNSDYRRAIAYLHRARGIDYGIITRLIDRKHLMQEDTTNNAIFPIYDENNAFVGAELEGTLSERRFKGVSAGSKYGYGFNIRFPMPHGEGYDYALFFESAVDLISFMDIKQNHENKPLMGCLLVSLAGLKLNILQHTLKAFTGTLQPILCVDRDNAGVEFQNAVEGLKIAYRTQQPLEGYKDWNEQLQAIKKKMT